MVNNQHILFIHIPKTAGTSFRLAAEEYFGKNNTFYDYSPKGKDTSKLIIDTIYDEQNPYRLYESISKLNHSFISGHFQVNKYAPLYDTLNIVSFVREPVEQVVSHYNHYKNLHDYKKDLVSFIKEPRFRNIQSKVLGGKPVEYYGFLGLTDEYNISIDMFNALYNTNLTYKYINTKRENSLNLEEIDMETIDLIKQLNEEDIEFYDKVKRQFNVRKELYEKKLPFTHGFLQKITKKQISGLAFQKDSSQLLEVDIYLNDTYLKTIHAKNLRPGQIVNNVPKKGFVGFDYIANIDNHLEGDFHAFIKESGQEIV